MSECASAAVYVMALRKTPRPAPHGVERPGSPVVARNFGNSGRSPPRRGTPLTLVGAADAVDQFALHSSKSDRHGTVDTAAGAATNNEGSLLLSRHLRPASVSSQSTTTSLSSHSRMFQEPRNMAWLATTSNDDLDLAHSKDQPHKRTSPMSRYALMRQSKSHAADVDSPSLLARVDALLGRSQKVNQDLVDASYLDRYSPKVSLMSGDASQHQQTGKSCMPASPSSATKEGSPSSVAVGGYKSAVTEGTTDDVNSASFSAISKCLYLHEKSGRLHRALFMGKHSTAEIADLASSAALVANEAHEAMAAARRYLLLEQLGEDAAVTLEAKSEQRSILPEPGVSTPPPRQKLSEEHPDGSSVVPSSPSMVRMGMLRETLRVMVTKPQEVRTLTDEVEENHVRSMVVKPDAEADVPTYTGVAEQVHADHIDPLTSLVRSSKKKGTQKGGGGRAGSTPRKRLNDLRNNLSAMLDMTVGNLNGSGKDEESGSEKSSPSSTVRLARSALRLAGASQNTQASSDSPRVEETVESAASGPGAMEQPSTEGPFAGEVEEASTRDSAVSQETPVSAPPSPNRGRRRSSIIAPPPSVQGTMVETSRRESQPMVPSHDQEASGRVSAVNPQCPDQEPESEHLEPLTSGWAQQFDENSIAYYYNLATRESRWDLPEHANLIGYWRQFWDEERGATFYQHTVSGDSRWFLENEGELLAPFGQEEVLAANHPHEEGNVQEATPAAADFQVEDLMVVEEVNEEEADRILRTTLPAVAAMREDTNAEAVQESTPTVPYVISIVTNFTATKETEMDVREGDIVRVTDTATSDDWFYGEKQVSISGRAAHRAGWFPKFCTVAAVFENARADSTAYAMPASQQTTMEQYENVSRIDREVAEWDARWDQDLEAEKARRAERAEAKSVMNLKAKHMDPALPSPLKRLQEFRKSLETMTRLDYDSVAQKPAPTPRKTDARMSHLDERVNNIKATIQRIAEGDSNRGGSIRGLGVTGAALRNYTRRPTPSIISSPVDKLRDIVEVHRD